MNENLPAFVVMTATWTGARRPRRCTIACGVRASCPASTRAWRCGVQGDPVLFLSNPPGVESRDSPPRCSTRWRDSTSGRSAEIGDPETQARIAQYEMAFRMQTSVPELTDTVRRTEARFGDVRSGRPQAGHVRGQLPAGSPHGRAGRAIRADLPPRLGPARQRGGRPAQSVPRRRSALLRADPGPEATRPAGRHAGRLGRRIRPHGLLPGQR